MSKPSIPMNVASGAPHTFGYLLIETFEDGSAIWEAPDGTREHWPDGMVLFRLDADAFHFKEPNR